MTPQIALVLIIVLAAVALFVTERLRIDLVALLVLVSLALTGLVNPEEALSGFSNPAVITVWAVFILSGSLSQTGVANRIGNQVMGLAGQGEIRLLLVIMLTAGVLSAFMNNVGVAALMLPVVVEIARRTRRSPSRLLMPLAFGCLMGGMMTLIGTPPNILVSDALLAAGLNPFRIFDFLPTGLAVMITGTAFMVLVGRHLLPERDVTRDLNGPDSTSLNDFYQIQERLFALRIPHRSTLAGMTLAESQLGSLLQLNVIAITRNGQTLLSPRPDTVLFGGDQLLVVGRSDQLTELHQHRVQTMAHFPLTLERLQAVGLVMARARLNHQSSLTGRSLTESGFRHQYGLHVVAIAHENGLQLSGLAETVLTAGDTLLLQGSAERMARLGEAEGFDVSDLTEVETASLEKMLLLVRVSEDSVLVGKSLAENRLGAAYGLTVLRVGREDSTKLLPEPDELVQAGDSLLVQGDKARIAAIRGLEALELEQTSPGVKALESAQVGLTEVILSPHSTLVGQTLRQIFFRDKYGLSVLAIWRAGRAYRANLRDMPLRFGDALLVYGPRKNFQVLGSEPDFVVLQPDAQPALRTEKGWLAVAIMAVVLLPVILGWLPIAIAAVMGAALMVLSGCLTMEEAYRYIEWPAVFLIAGMLPLGIAMQNSGAAQFLADVMVTTIGDFGPFAIMAGLFILSILASQVMPNPAVVVLMAPIALNLASDLSVAPQSFLMTTAVAASAAFLSPVGHPANVLIMGPGGYRFVDYIRVGLPLTITVMLVTMLVIPLVWPL
jgi:di/tricarboxylate transporter